MKRALNAAILLLLVASVRAKQPASPAQTKAEEIHLRAAVKAVVPLTDFSGKVTPVDADPRFALTVRIVAASPSVEQFSNGAVVTLAIHSPTLLFAGDVKEGKTYDFYLRRKVEGGQARFFGLRVAKKT